MDEDIFELIEKMRQEFGIYTSKISKAYSEILAFIAGCLMEYRVKNELTQEEVANKVFMPVKLISDIEAGIHDITLSELVFIVGMLGGEIKLELKLGSEGEE